MKLAVLVAAAVLLWLGSAARAEDRMIAIDILLQPDDVMLAKAAEWNARMREQSPEGFSLDAEHRPHISLLQRYVRTSDLDAVLTAVERVRGKFDVSQMRMEATGLYHIPSGKMGLAGIVVAPSPQLKALQAAMIQAVTPFAVSGGDQSAFVPDPSGTPFDPILFKYVDTFVPAQTGEHFNPHVTIGVAPLAWLEALEKQPFSAFNFGARGVAVYHLGNFGTAARRLDLGQTGH
jgi:hypothetical protein